jgi:hypothetical protein
MANKTRKWTVTGRDSQDRVIQNGPFTDKAAARRQAEINARQHGTSFRVSTRGSFGSFTVTPDQV